MAWNFLSLLELRSPLSKCRNLRQLDLSLVTENVSLPRLLQSIRKLERLKQLSIRCKNPVADDSSCVVWPPRLEALRVTGLFNDIVLDQLTSLPESLKSLTLYACPRLTLLPVKSLTQALGCSLELLYIGPLGPQSGREDLIQWLEYLPHLRQLHACESWSFIPEDFSHLSTSKLSTGNSHPLECLELDCSRLMGMYGYEWNEAQYELLWNLVDEGFLGNLRNVKWYHRRDANMPKHVSRAIGELDELLRALAREDGENARISEEDAGAYSIRV